MLGLTHDLGSSGGEPSSKPQFPGAASATPQTEACPSHSDDGWEAFISSEPRSPSMSLENLVLLWAGVVASSALLLWTRWERWP